MKSSTLFIAIALCFILQTFAFADSGVLTPNLYGQDANTGSLTLSRMEVRVEVDNGMAKVAVLQIYQNNYDREIEGQYRFTIPETAELSGFAIWEDGIRIPGVIMERRQARETYQNLVTQRLDPGLMEEGDEEDADVFTCRVFPILPWGTKRLELTYTQHLSVDSESTYFYFPTEPTTGHTQHVDFFRFDMTYHSDEGILEPEFVGERLIPEITQQTPKKFSATFIGDDLDLSENITVKIPVPVTENKIVFMTYRDVEKVWRNISPVDGKNYKDDAGFYGARILFAKGDNKSSDRPRQVVFALDTSLSMQWEKLDRALEMATEVISKLEKTDLLGVVTFNADVSAMKEKVEPCTIASLSQAETWIRSRTISGGTDFSKLFEKIAKQFHGPEKKQVILITDGAPTLTEINPKQITNAFKKSRLYENSRLFVVGIGNDANRTLLSDLAENGGGPYIHLGSTEDFSYKMQLLLDRMSGQVIEGVTFDLPGLKVLDRYPKGAKVAFGGGSLDFVGRYSAPGTGKAVVKYLVDGQSLTFSIPVELPETSADHVGLRRRWAKARVTELMDRINRDGEQKEWIEEIIELSRQYTFVTPYTSFLAAPRSLLRPRVIRPGDPILRVKTDSRITRVVASFPFGLTQNMKYLPEEDIWQLRFLAPPGWPDGAYECNLYLTDINGRRYIENKKFIIDGRPPEIFPKISGEWIAGRSVEVVAAASRDTRRLSARVPFAGYCELRYDDDKKVSIGTLTLPEAMPPGSYDIQWFAEDFAHNVTRETSVVEVTSHE